MQDAFAHCERLVRDADKDRFLASLFAPAERRAALHALYAFDLEVERIGQRVHEPMAGEVRLQWWREALAGEREAEASANPVAAALLETVATLELPRGPLEGLLDARTFDLYADPMASSADLAAYGQRTVGSIISLAATALGASPDDDPAIAGAARNAGTALTVASALQHLPRDAARGKLYVPVDLLERYGVGADDYFAARAAPGLLSALAELREGVRRDWRAVQAAMRQMPERVRPAFLPASLAPLVVDRMERRGYDPFKSDVQVPQWRRQWRLWRAARGAGA